ncbi:MAG: UbiD family decarboxylase [Chloroflexi bacterium]|nr:UbiD family decarboxylase [Chloroflexota bacterium]
MPDDLRDWLRKVQQLNGLRILEGVDWNLEMGFFTAENWKQKESPALLFDKVPGYAPGFRVLTSSIQAPSRVALTLGLPRMTSDIEFLEVLRQKLRQWEASLGNFEPNLVPSSPVFENTLSGNDLDLLKFPAPFWHEKDGGRYLGTGDALITRDPDTNHVNLGTYRVMVQDAKTMGLYMAPGRHGKIHCEKHHAMGRPCPMVLSIGHHPLVFATGCQQFPEGTEYAFIGAIQGEPADIMIEEVTGLPVPASSEILIAGWCPPGKTMKEGPFGEYTGYYASGERPAPIIEVGRIYYRSDPIMLGAPPGRPPNENSFYNLLITSVILHHELEKSGVPDVVNVCVHDIVRNLLVTVSLKQRYAGHAKQVAVLASELAATGGMGPRYVIVVDEDIDVTSIKDVFWAICTRSEPDKDIDILRRVRSSPLDPAIRKPAEAFFTSRALIDACKPFEWINEFPEAVDFSSDFKKKMLTKWGRKQEGSKNGY